MKTERENLAARFLLGKLTEEEAVKIEEEYFGGNSYFENLLSAENDLIDAYVKGDLSAEDRKRFESRLLLNPRQRQRVEFAKTLINYAASGPAEGSESSPAKLTLQSVLAQIFSARSLLSYSFAVVFLILLAGTIFWLAIKNNSSQFSANDELASTQSEDPLKSEQKASPDQVPFVAPTPSEAVNSKDDKTEVQTSTAERLPKNAGNQPSPQSRSEKSEKTRSIISTIILPLGTTRGGALPVSFDVPVRTDLINLQLKFEEGDFAGYSFVLETVEGQKIWSGKINQAVKDKSKKTVLASVPARKLENGDYIISLRGLTKEGAYESIGDYSFTIVRR